MTKYSTSSHAKYRLQYHIIFSTKYRRKCLNQIRENIFAVFKEVQNKSDFEISVMEIDEDHIHFLMKWKPSLSIEQVVRRMEQLSTVYLWRDCYSHLSKFYWGNKKLLWTGGYFCTTVGDASEKQLNGILRIRDS